MAEHFELGEAVLELITDEKGLILGLTNAEHETKASVGRMTQYLSGLAAIALPAGILGSLEALGTHARHAADEMHELSQMSGISVEDLSRLEFAGKQAGLELTDITTAVRFLSRQMVKGEDDIGKPSHALDKLGIASKNARGELRPTIDVLLDVSEKFSHMQDGAEKTAIAVELFGRAGTRMIPMLNEGREKLEELAAAADRMGVTISGEVATAAHEFGDNMKVLGMYGRALGNEIITTTMPAFASFTKALTADYIPDLEAAGQATKTFGTELEDTHKSWHPIRDALNQLSQGFFNLTVAARQSIATIVAVHSAYDILAKDRPGTAAEQQHQIAIDLKKLWGDYTLTVQKMSLEAVDNWDKLTGATKEGARGAHEHADAVDEETKKVAKLNRELEIAILQKKHDLAAAKGQKDAAEMYAHAIDVANAQDKLAAGANQALVDVLNDVSAQERKATEDVKDRAKAERAAHKAISDRQAQERKDDELLVAFGERERQYEHFLEQQQKHAREFDDFIESSVERIQNLTMGGAQRERADAIRAHHDRMQEIDERFDNQLEKDIAIAQSQRELNSTLLDINERYADDVAHVWERLLDEQQTAQQELLGHSIGAITDSRDAMQSLFFDAMKGNFRNFDDDLKGFFDNFRHRIAQFLADELTKRLMKFLIDLVLSYTGNRLPTSAVVGAGTSLAPAGFASGGVLPFGVRGYAGGGVVTQPSLFAAGENYRPEAIVPLKSGGIPVMFNEGAERAPVRVENNTKVLIGADVLQSMKSSPDEVIAIVRGALGRGGPLYAEVKQISTRR